ncbi:MAG: hypothetical protein GY717_17555 [Rhodobacteraceae bacterium]|nr:hypothetical protein [Paracoccaceae bacterium]
MRRCLVRNLSLPEKREELIETLVARGRAHFEDLSDNLLNTAAGKVADDREFAQNNHLRPLPGQAEYIDLLRVIYEQGKTEEEREARLEKVRPYVVAKGFTPVP